MGRGDSFGKQNFWMISDWSSSLNPGYQVGPMETTPKARKKGQPREMNLTAQCLICNGPAAAHQVFLGRLYIWCWFPTLCCYCGCLDPQPPPTNYGLVQFDTLQHYGAVCCYSCRAFFRRGITRSYVCVRGDDLCQVGLCHSKFITIYIAFNHRSTASHGPIASDVDTQGAWLLVWNQSWWTPPLSANRSAPCLVM